ncbi:MAG: UvrD-helicase domain-containing protein, partial [Actinobacteria bacterium]|nr:UvrD-helicase domain-containing protein [Actinomycetota bacterium]
MTSPFDATAPLVSGITVLEASAGTGKTHALTSVVLRLVAVDGVAIERIAVMTFTRNAARELRQRVRRRLLDVVDPRPPRDDLVGWLHSGADREQRLARVRAALRDYDQATVTTIHAFFGQCLAAVLGGGGAPLLEDESGLVAEVINDLYVKGFAAADDARLEIMPPPWHVERIVRAALVDPRARIVPPPSGRTREGLQAAFAVRARERTRQRRLAAGVRSFDDLQAELAELVETDGDRVRAALAARFDAALVDELQDTDQLQWELLTDVFSHGRVFAVGDPKQAIYGFRGGDVHTFVRALEEADAHAALVTNRRSDPSYLAACDALFAGQTFGDPRIAYHHAQPHHTGDRWIGEAHPPLEIRTLEPAGTRADGTVPAGLARDLASRDAARVAAALLDDGRTQIAGDGEPRPLRAADVAVLVRTNAQAALMHRRLADAGVPAVLGSIGNVLHAQAASEWLALLRALQEPSVAGLARRAALTPFVGWTGDHLAAAGSDELGRLHDDLHSWARLLAQRGVPALVDRLAAAGYAARLLAAPGGARVLADVEHLAELLHRAGGPSPTPALLHGWLERAVA